MVNNVKPGYVNPLAMMGSNRSRQAKPLYSEGPQTAEKRKRSLETEKQSIQNSLLLMKGTSGDAGSTEETIKVLEKKLEDITKEIKLERQEPVKITAAKEEQVKENEGRIMYRNLDIYI